MSFSKSNLKTGMFGVTGKNEFFVVVNNLLVYKDGGYDTFDDIKSDLTFNSGRTIEKVFNRIVSFSQLEDNIDNGYTNNLVYDRHPSFTEMTLAEIEQKLGIKNLKIIKEN